MAFAPHLGAVVSHDLLRVQAHDPGDRGYLYAFLRSRFGRTMLRSSKYGSVVKHLEAAHLIDVPVPAVPDGLRKQLNAQLEHVFQLREETFTSTQEAENIYTQQFPAVAAVGSEAGYVGRASQTFGGQRRLDAFHYNPRARSVLAALKGGANEVVPLSDVAETIFGVPRFKHVYRSSGIPYLDSEDLFKLNPEISKFIPELTKKDASRYYVKRGWILMASSGQLYGLNGSVVLADSWHEQKIVSNHVLRVVPRDIRPGYLTMALGHPTLGRPLVLRQAFGSEVPEISPESLAVTPIARLGAVENEIATRMERASALRMEADLQEDASVDEFERRVEWQLHGRPNSK